MKRVQGAVVLELRFVRVGEAIVLEVDAVNRGAQPVTIAAHEKYFTIEVENELGQFVNRSIAPGAPAMTALPKATDYRTIVAKAAATVLRLELGHDPSLARVRVTYKAADRTMPNLPRDRQQTFFPGPIDAISERDSRVER